MKIAVVSANTPSHLGIRADLIQSFLNRGHEVVAFGGEPEKEWRDVFASKGHGYRQFFVNRAGTNPLQDFRTILSLKRLYQDERPDKVFTYHAKGNIYGSIAAHSAGIDDTFCLVAGLGSIFRDNPDKFSPIRAVMSLEYRQALKYPKNVFFQNMDDASVFIENGIVEAEKIVLVNGSGVDTVRYSYSDPAEKPSFLFVGRLLKDKGVQEFISAARMLKVKYPEVEFNIVGRVDANPTSLTSNEVELLAREKIVVFHGEQDDVLPFYQQNAVFVLPSYHEGTPRSALEAMSVGRPVILTDAPGCRDVVVNGENGFMVPVKDSIALASAMERFILDPLLAASMGEKSRTIAVEKYDVDKVNDVICTTMRL